MHCPTKSRRQKRCGIREKMKTGGMPLTPKHELDWHLQSATLPALEARLASITMKYEKCCRLQVAG